MTPHFDKRSNTGLRHFLNAARFSIDGIKSALNHESAFRQECVACIVLFPLAFVIAEHFITAVALISICLMFLLHQLQRLQDGLVVDAQEYCEKFLLNRISKVGSN